MFKIKAISSYEKTRNLLNMGEAQLSLITNDARILKVHFQCLFTVTFKKFKVNVLIDYMLL